MIHSGSFLTPRNPDEVFDLLANPERFAPLLPDYESMSAQDSTHFTVLIVIAVGKISGHANVAMELCEAVRPGPVAYRGQGTVAGSQLNLALSFHITPSDSLTEVKWQGEFSLDGTLAIMARSLIEPMGRKNFERMGERICSSLSDGESAAPIPPNPEIQD